MPEETNTANVGGGALDLGQRRGLSASYRRAAVAMVNLAAIDERIHDCNSSVQIIEQALDDLRQQLNRLSLQLDERKRGATLNSQGPRTGGGSIVHSPEGLLYSQLFEKYENSEHVSRSRRRVLQSEILSIARRRSQMIAQIPSDLLTSYETLDRAGLRPAITAVTAGLCGGCKERVGLDVYDGLESGQEVLRCPRCGRFLFLPSWDRHV